MMLKETIPALLSLVLAGTPAQAQQPPFIRDAADPVSSFALRDRTGNEQQHMIVPAPQPGRLAEERCMPGTRLCFSVTERSEYGQPLLRVRKVGEAGAAAPFTVESLPLDLVAKDDAVLSIWSLGIRRAATDRADAPGDAMIVGIEALERGPYSGGGFHKIVLWLYRIDKAGTDQATARQILSVPFGASQIIRACFNRQDEAKRRGACVDETEVKAMLVLDDSNRDAMPRLIYHVFTGSYPGDLPFRAPEDVPARLTQRDLVKTQHATCSYDRKLAWNPATYRYEFDSPAPDCRVFGLER